MSAAEPPGAETPQAALAHLGPRIHEYECTIKIIVLARDAGHARRKLGALVSPSLQVVSIEPTEAEQARWVASEPLARPYGRGQIQPDGSEVREEYQPWRGGGEVPGG